LLFIYVAPTCDTEEPLVTGTTPIPDAYMTASSIYQSTQQVCPAYHARLHGSAAWSPEDAEKFAPVPNMYLQVSVEVTGQLL